MADEKTNQPTEPEQDEVFVFVLHEHKLKTVSGEEVTVPKCSWGKELRIIKLAESLMKEIVESGVVKSENDAELYALLLNVVFRAGPEKLEEAVKILLGNEQKYNSEWIRDNLESEEMLGLVVPFLYGKSKTVGAALSPYWKQIGARAKTLMN